MSLLSIEISKVKRLSLRDVKLPAPELRVEPTTTIQIEKPPTAEEIAYSSLVTINPLIDILVERLDLVSIKTRERIRKLEVIGVDVADIEPILEPIKPPDKNILKQIANVVLGLRNNLYKEVLIAKIGAESKVDKNRAEIGFNLMLQAGIIERTNVNTYYLTESTPF
jgi:hypothetical protein